MPKVTGKPLKKKPQRKTKKRSCIACGGTGLSSKGLPCIPCQVNKTKKK